MRLMTLGRAIVKRVGIARALKRPTFEPNGDVDGRRGVSVRSSGSLGEGLMLSFVDSFASG